MSQSRHPSSTGRPARSSFSKVRPGTGPRGSGDSAHSSAPEGPSGSPARAIALRVLSDLREGRQSARQAIDELIEHQPASPQDRALATELVMGVIRHRLTLARVLSLYTTRGWQRVAARLQHILMIGAYQILWLDGIPDFAAVDEAVEQGKHEGGPHTGRFINAVLRNLIRDIEQRRMPIDQSDPVRSVPVDDQRVCQVKRPFLPDPKTNPVAYWADATSHPAWLVARWQEAFGLDAAVRICRAGMTKPPVILRPNRLRIDEAALAKMLEKDGVQTQVVPGGRGLVVTGGGSFLATRAFAEGLFQPQDRTAMEVLPLACKPCPEPGQIVVDVCAGLGTKATQLAEMTRDQSVILATDKDSSKLELLRANALRLGCQSLQVVPPARLATVVASVGGAHCVLVDAPCSNSGVFARRPEARYRLTQRMVEKLAELQARLLSESAELLRPGGRLIYVTCSIDPHENEHVATAFGMSHPDWTLIESRLTLPDTGPTPADWRDGGYWAVWKKEPLASSVQPSRHDGAC